LADARKIADTSVFGNSNKLKRTEALVKTVEDEGVTEDWVEEEDEEVVLEVVEVVA
jgi:hypothetical protein